MFKSLQKISKWRPAESYIRPYRQLRQQARGICLGGVESGNRLLVRLQARNPAFDFTCGNMFAQLPQQTCID